MGLSRLAQQDLSAGMWRSLSPERIPSNGCYDLTNFLIDNQGLPFVRGGIDALSTAFTSSDLTFVHDGLYATGRRTFFASKTEFGVLDSDGVTPILLWDATGFPIGGLANPVRGTMVGGRLYIDGGRVYAGSRKYGFIGTTPGTASVTPGSAIVTGTGTAFLTDSAPGMVFGFGPRNYVVQSVEDDTHMTLTQVAKDAESGVYAIGAVGTARKTADIYGTAGRRLLALIGDKLYFSRNQDPINEITRTDGTFQGIESLPDEDPENFHDGDYHQIPGNPTGLGIESWGDTAIVFTTDGIWLISNMDLQPVDDAGYQQEQLTHTAPQVVLWHRNGLAKFADTHVVPARDGIYLLGTNSLERIDTPITPLYRDYYRQGYTLGLAKVFEGHYFLPVLSGTSFVDTLVCRIDRPTSVGRSPIRPWSHFNGLPVRAFEVQVPATGSPNLLIASTGDKLLRARYFEPGTVSTEDNGSTFAADLVTRDFPTGNGNQNLVRQIDVDYDLTAGGGDNPVLEGDFATTHPAESATYTSAGADAPKGTDLLQQWQLEDTPPRTRYVRFRLRTSGRLQNLIIRSIAFWVRGSAKSD